MIKQEIRNKQEGVQKQAQNTGELPERPTVLSKVPGLKAKSKVRAGQFYYPFF